MENAITKTMYVRTLTEKEYEAVKKKDTEAIKRIAGIDRSFRVGDCMVAFADKPVKWGLYKVNWKGDRAVYYIVQSVFTKDRAFCYSVY